MQLVRSTVFRRWSSESPPTSRRQASHVDSQMAVGRVQPKPLAGCRLLSFHSKSEGTALGTKFLFHSSELLPCRHTPRHDSPTHENGQNKLSCCSSPWRLCQRSVSCSMNMMNLRLWKRPRKGMKKKWMARSPIDEHTLAHRNNNDGPRLICIWQPPLSSGPSIFFSDEDDHTYVHLKLHLKLHWTLAEGEPRLSLVPSSAILSSAPGRPVQGMRKGRITTGSYRQ